LLPTMAVDEVIVHWPVSCGCGHVFCDGERVPVGDPVRHQVEELPEIATVVIEHQCQRLRCPKCGARARATLPAEVAQSAFGPRFQAAMVTLSVRNRISRRDVVELCEQLFRARISTGTVDAIIARAGDALEDPYDDLLERVRRAKALNMDETGWRLQGSKRTLWGAFTDRHAALQIRPNRHEDHARDLLARPDNTVSLIARLLNVSRSTIYKYVPQLGGRASDAVPPLDVVLAVLAVDTRPSPDVTKDDDLLPSHRPPSGGR